MRIVRASVLAVGCAVRIVVPLHAIGGAITVTVPITAMMATILIRAIVNDTTRKHRAKREHQYSKLLHDFS